MTSTSEAARQLAALRRRATFVCEVCTHTYEAWVRKSQQARTCSQSCRQRAYRLRQKQRPA